MELFHSIINEKHEKHRTNLSTALGLISRRDSEIPGISEMNLRFLFLQAVKAAFVEQHNVVVVSVVVVDEEETKNNFGARALKRFDYSTCLASNQIMFIKKLLVSK